MKISVRLLILFVLACLIVGFMASNARAETYPGDPHHADRTLVVYVDRAVPSDYVRAISEHLNTWNRIRPAKAPKYVAASYVSDGCRYRGTGTISYCVNNNQPTVARARTFAVSKGHFTGGAIIEFNLNLKHSASLKYQVWHEAGHPLGLNHNDRCSSVMSYCLAHDGYDAQDMADLTRIHH